MSDVQIVRRNVTKLINAGATEEDIDAYIDSEGLTLDQVRAGAAAQQPTAASMTYRPVETSPLPLPESPKPPLPNIRFQPKQLEQAAYDWRKTAAESGVRIDQPQQAGRYELGFAYDPQSPSSREFISGRMSSERNQGVPPPERQTVDVRLGPQTQEVEFYDPESRRYSMYDPPYTEKGDIKELAAPAGQLGIEALATVGASAGGPQMAILGGAGSAAMTEYARLKIGQQMGLNKELSDQDIAKQALLVAGLAAVGGEAALALTKGFKAVDNLIAGRIFTRGMQETWQPNRAMAQRAQAQLEGILKPGDPRLKMNLAQQTGDPNLLQMQDMYLRTPGPRQMEMIAQRKAQQDALAAAKANIDRPMGQPVSGYEAGHTIQNPIQAGQQAAAARAGAATQQADVAAQQAATLPAGSLTVAGSRAAAGMVNEKQAFKTWARQEAGKVQALAGGIEIPNKNLSGIANTFSKETRESIFPPLQADKRGLVGPETTDGQLSRIFDPNTRWTFDQAWDAVSTLKRLASKAKSDPSTLGPDAATYTRAYQALEADIADALKGTPAATAYDAFRAQYRSQKALLDNALEEALNTQPDKVFRNVFVARDREAADELSFLLQGNPQARASWRAAIFDHYKEFVSAKGRVTAGRHDEWIKQYGSMAKEYFSPSDFKLLQNAKSAEIGFLRAQVQEKEVLDRIAGSFGGKLAGMDARQIAGYLFGKDKVGELKQFRAVATPEMVQALRGNVLRNQERLLTNTDPMTNRRVLSYAKLDKYIGDHEAEIGELFGKKYLSDLKTVREGLRLVQQTPPTGNVSGSGIVTGDAQRFLNSKLGAIFSIYAGPLSHGRYAVRQALNMRARIAEEVIYNAMKDPDSLSRLVELRYLNPKSKRAAAILGQLGGLSLYEEQK